MATGSYEGSLPMEGIPDHSKRHPSRGGVDVILAAFSRISTVVRRHDDRAREGEATGVSEARSAPSVVERKHPRSRFRGKTRFTRPSFDADPPKRSERRETLRSPVSHAEPQNPRGAPHGESRDSEPGAPKVRVHASCLGGRCRSDASRVFTPGRSQGLVEVEGASLKEARSTA
jgi:hypothetical protein